MKKTLSIAAVLALFASQSFATYVVVLRDGTRYNAKAKWTVANGKALVNLQDGRSIQLDPALIDVAQSEKLTRLGITNASIVDLNPNLPEIRNPEAQKPSLGSHIRLKRPGSAGPAPGNSAAPAPSRAGASAPPAVVPSGPGRVSEEAIDKFARAFENVGIFEQKLTATGPRSLRAELTADSEDKVFNAISATSFLMVRNAGVSGVQIDMIELFMKTTNGGAAGRFQMSRADAEALDKRTMSQQDYFVRRVIY